MCQNQCTYYPAYVSHAEARWEALDYRASKSRSKAATELSVGARVQFGSEARTVAYTSSPCVAIATRAGNGDCSDWKGGIKTLLQMHRELCIKAKVMLAVVKEC
jgi:hypothetical protein